tara:strand:+ start:24 stop:533 length:510 start_codon:yes stop_codon:yes gene_type:complete
VDAIILKEVRNAPMQTNSQAILLRIAELVAMSDGSISSQEESLIRDLPKRLGISVQADHQDPDRTSLKTLAGQLVNHGDRCTAARIACLVAGVSRNPKDQQDINSDERMAYRELVSELHLSEEELQEIEWSAKEELKQGKPLLELIGLALFGDGGWPDRELMGPEIPGL